MNKKYLMGIAAIICTILFTHIPFFPAQAASSTNVPLENELYRDMEFWAAEGLIGSQLSSIKPFARSEVGKQIVMALDKCAAMATPTATCKNIQAHYAKLFEAEIAEARSAGNTSGTFLKPVESASLSYKYLSGPYSNYNNEGINYNNGSNAMIQLQSSARLWNIFSFYVQPLFLYNQHSVIDEEGSNTEGRLHKGYAKLNVFNLELEAGRDSLWWGPGYHGALLMSNNSHPFDMIKLSNPEPVLLPWIFSYLGPVQFNLIFSQLNDERTAPELANPFLYGLRLVIKPHPYLELGASQLVEFGGSGRRDLSFSDIITTLYSNTNRDGLATDSNGEFAVDFTLTIPNTGKYIFLADGIKAYCEVGAEDTGNPPDRRAYLAGLALFKPIGLQRAVLRVEYAIMSPYSVPLAWYNHSTYPMFYEGRVFGNHAGSDAEDFFVEWSQSFEKIFYKLSFDRERSGIQTQIYPQFKNQYQCELGYRFNDNLNITLSYGYETIKNLGNIQNESQTNHFLGVDAVINF